jgi:acetoin utilization protein AcuB
MDIQAKELTNKSLITVKMGTKISVAAEMMRKHHIRHLPITDDRNQIVGILSTHDFSRFGEQPNFNVEFYMHAPVIFVHESTPLKEAVNKILENKISCLLIANDQTHAVGIISTDDLLRYLVNQLEEESEESRSVLTRIMDLPTINQVAYQISLTGI